MTKPAYWNPKHFTPGQRVSYGDFQGTIVRHYNEGMWEVHLPGGFACVAGAFVGVKLTGWMLTKQRDTANLSYSTSF